MESFLNKINRKTWQIAAIVLVVLGISLILLQFYGQYTLIVNGKPQQLRTFALTPRQVLHAAGLSLQPEDRILPEADKLNLTQRTIILNQAAPIQIAQGENIITLQTAERIPANLLAELGIVLFPEDRILRNGSEIAWDEPLPPGEPILLQFQPAHRINLNVDEQEIVLFTQQRTLGAALLEAGIYLRAEDRLSLPQETVLRSTTELSVKKASPVSVAYAGKQISGLSAAETVGEALAEIGIPLQNLDYTIPAENEPLPADGSIRLVQVREEIQLEKEETAYQNTYVEDPNAELDTISVIEPGQVGLVVTRTRVRLEDGKEVASFTEGPWKASDPQDGVLGRGTKVVVRTETIDGETIEYWRKVTVYATSYCPRALGGDNVTASGMTLTKGIIAVRTSWYSVMQFQPVYVPGYGRGIIADTGGGIDGRYWIDLGYDDSNYVGWHYWTTLYFLTPVPAYIPTVLP
jgi:uncharacterized protein YabE (DUF348 family)